MEKRRSKFMEKLEQIDIPKNIIELTKIILEQNRIILMTNKFLLERLAALPVMYVREEK